jgi:hypothetical protein
LSRKHRARLVGIAADGNDGFNILARIRGFATI